MLRWEGFAFAGAAALGHSGIDATRKIASQRFSSPELVALVALLDATFLTTLVFATGLAPSTAFLTPQLCQILVLSAALKVLCGYLYQRALHASPLSCTVPYLAFTPALLLGTAFVLIGEVPSKQGLLGEHISHVGIYYRVVIYSPACEYTRYKHTSFVTILSFKTTAPRLPTLPLITNSGSLITNHRITPAIE